MAQSHKRLGPKVIWVQEKVLHHKEFERKKKKNTRGVSVKDSILRKNKFFLGKKHRCKFMKLKMRECYFNYSRNRGKRIVYIIIFK